jgi:hypothetical protein
VSLSVPESAVLENVLPELEADGFEVYARPAGHLLPSFMRTYVPDAIALREGRKLAIEVLSDEPSAKRKLAHIQELFSKQKDWELRVYWLSPNDRSQAVEARGRKRPAGSSGSWPPKGSSPRPKPTGSGTSFRFETS